MSEMSTEHYREDSEQAAREQFYNGLRVMASIPGHAQNFAWCLERLAGAQDYEAQFRGMMEFLRRLGRGGREEVEAAIEASTGIPVTVTHYVGQRRVDESQGHIYGLLGADYNNPHMFYGVAVTEIKGREYIISVNIDTEKPETVTHVVDPKSGNPQLFRPKAQ